MANNVLKLIQKLLDKFGEFLSNEGNSHFFLFTLPTIIAFAILSFIEPNFIYILVGAIIATIIIGFCFKFISLSFREGGTNDQE